MEALVDAAVQRYALSRSVDTEERELLGAVSFAVVRRVRVYAQADGVELFVGLAGQFPE